MTCKGLAVEIRGTLEGRPMEGMLVIAAPYECQLFYAAAATGPERWGSERRIVFAEILDSIVFFELP